jgi:hypothetical protein
VSPIGEWDRDPAHHHPRGADRFVSAAVDGRSGLVAQGRSRRRVEFVVPRNVRDQPILVHSKCFVHNSIFEKCRCRATGNLGPPWETSHGRSSGPDPPAALCPELQPTFGPSKAG